MTKELYQAVSELASSRQGSRSGNASNSHPQTRRSYALRSYVYCHVCGRRMYGKVRRSSAYYVCRLDKRHHAERRGWYDSHPNSLWVREDELLDLTHQFFADHVLGPHRSAALRTTDQNRPEPIADPAIDRLLAELADLAHRRDNLLIQIEEHKPSGDDEIDREFRSRLRTRYADLARQHKATSDRLAALAAQPTEPDDDTTVLEHLPVITGADLADLPHQLLRDLCESFHLSCATTSRTMPSRSESPSGQTGYLRCGPQSNEPQTPPDNEATTSHLASPTPHRTAVPLCAARLVAALSNMPWETRRMFDLPDQTNRRQDGQQHGRRGRGVDDAL